MAQRFLILSLLFLMPHLRAVGDTASVNLPASRAHFATTEAVELVLFCPSDATAADFVTLALQHADGSVVDLDLPLDVSRTTSRTRLVTLQPGSLKPGEYTAKVKGAAKDTPVRFWIHLAENRNAFYTGQWVQHGATAANVLAKGGWMYMNTDYVPLPPRKPGLEDLTEAYVAAGMQPFALNTCGTGHQLDGDPLNDWGDPWVQRAVAWRCQLSALSNRIYPIAGLHVIDEPALSWWPIKDAAGTVQGSSPFAVPHQLAEYETQAGVSLPRGLPEETLPQYGNMLTDWLAFMDMRMKYLGQAWYAAAWGTRAVAPALTVINEVSCSYAPHAVTDGVDSRQNKPFTMISGHGQYSDLPFGTLQPLRGATSYRGFSWQLPHLYLPMWYTHNWATVRAAVWISWASKLEGILYSPELDFALDGRHYGYYGTDTIFEVAEINRRLTLAGGLLRRMPRSPSPVAVLQSHTQVAWDLAAQNRPRPARTGQPASASNHREAVNACFFRIVDTGMIPDVVDEVEAVEKGAAFLRQWPLLFCPALTQAPPAFRQALEGYIAAGGRLVQFRADPLVLPGAIRADQTFGNATEYHERHIRPEQDAAAKARDQGDTVAETVARVALARANTDLAWRHWNKGGAPNFAVDLAAWLGPQPYSTSNPQVLLNVQRAGDEHLLLLANNAQSVNNPRTLKHELIPAETTITVPSGSFVYDVFKGGSVPLTGNRFTVQLAAGDGACFLRLPAPPPTADVHADLHALNALRIKVYRGKTGYLPVRIRVSDPAGNLFAELYRATAPEGDEGSAFKCTIPLGVNAAPGRWRVQVDDGLTENRVDKTVTVKDVKPGPVATLDSDQVSVYFDDARRIGDLLAGKVTEPDWSQLNHDAPRVFGMEPRKFAIFAIEERRFIADMLAAALTAKGMEVTVNPPYAITPFTKEPARGGPGPIPWAGNLENIGAHTVVLPDHPLLAQSWARGHINRTVTPTFPGPGRAYIQWGMSCYQMGFQNIFLFGDAESGASWLLQALKGEVPVSAARPLTVRTTLVPVTPKTYPKSLRVRQRIRVPDTPTGVGLAADGRQTFCSLYDGSVTAYDAEGRASWQAQPLQEAAALAVSPQGDRLAVAGYPGLVILKTKDGRVVDGYRAEPKPLGNWMLANRMTSVAWNSAGTRVAGGWVNNVWRGTSGDPHEVVVLDEDGKLVSRPRDIPGNVYGVAFVPGSDTLLVGADSLTAVNTADGRIQWRNEVRGAQVFVFLPDGKTAAAGGWGRSLAVFSLTDGKILYRAETDAVVGGLALVPQGNLLVAAVWGGSRPLVAFRLPQATTAPTAPEDLPFSPRVFFQSQFGFQSVAWSGRLNALVAAEQGGRVWLLAADGTPQAMRDDDGSTTVYRLLEAGGEMVVGRMNRVVQRLTLRNPSP